MSAPEKSFKPMPVSNDVVLKRVAKDGSSSYQSSKEFAKQVLEPIRDNCYPQELCKQGIKAEILEPGKNWITGAIRLRLVVEFIPDEPENNGKSDKFGSTLDDIRNIKL